MFVAITQLPYAIGQDSEGWGTMVFIILYGPIIGGTSLLLGVFPSALLYWKKRRRIDLISLWVSGITLALVIATCLLIEPLRHRINFEHY